MDRAVRLKLVPPLREAREGGALESRSDDELVLLARGGIDAAFETLIRRHQGRALRIAARYLGDAALAADVAQNAFVEVLRSLPSYQARGRFSSYLWRILLNQCHMAYRSLRAERRALRTAGVAAELDEREVLQRERRRDLEFALGHLSEKLRSVVLLRYAADLSYDEIAQALDIPTGTVKRRLFDAMGKLRDALEGS